MDWNDYTEIAEMLQELYPNTSIDALSLSNEDLKKMIVSLPGFTGDENDPDADFHRKFIRSEWVSIRMPETFHLPDSAYLWKAIKINGRKRKEAYKVSNMRTRGEFI